MEGERPYGELPRAGERRVDGRPLRGAHLEDQTLGLERHATHRNRDDRAAAHDARHLHYGLGIEERQARAVRDVEDADCVALGMQRID